MTMSDSSTGSRRLLQLVQLGPLVPVGPPFEATILGHPEESQTSVQFLDAEERTVLGYLVRQADGTLAYESIAEGEGDQLEAERMIRLAKQDIRHGAPDLETATLHLASGTANFYRNPRWELVSKQRQPVTRGFQE